MSWSANTDAISDLRLALSDGATDKPFNRKACLGETNGTNNAFKTFDFRLLTDLSTATAPLGVFVNDAFVTTDSCNLETGDFTLHVAPVEGDKITATGYFQYWLDSQLDLFLRNASNTLGQGDNYWQLPGGLQAAAIKYACADAYQELSPRFSRMMSERYRMEDLPKEILRATIDGWAKLSDQYFKTGEKIQLKFYKGRQDQSSAPIFATIRGHVKDVKPDR